MKNEIGNRYGKLVVVARGLNVVRSSRSQEARWWCMCDCGNETLVRGGSLRRGDSRSCGCLAAELSSDREKTHGLREHPLYATWAGMHQRCRNPNATDYHRYGGRGITICDEWSGPDGFPRFVADMGERPEGYTLDRIDNDGNYEPDNCRWATPKEQSANRANTGHREVETDPWPR